MHTNDTTTKTSPKSDSPLRDVIAFTGLTYVLVTLVALAPPAREHQPGVSTPWRPGSRSRC